MEKKNLGRQALSLPNLLSYFRILLIPVCALLYLRGHNLGALAVLIVSGLTDIVDGKIARRYNMVTDLGKVLDPVADKLTQGVLIICVAGKTPILAVLAGILIIKEAAMITSGYILYKNAGVVNSSKWYGKLCTIMIYVTLVVHIVVRNIPPAVTYAAVAVCAGLMLLSFVLYNIKFFRQLRLRSGDNGMSDNDTKDSLPE